MSVFATHNSPSSFSIFRTLAFGAALAGAFFLARPDSPTTANVSGYQPKNTFAPSPTVFAQPVDVAWEGRVSRTLAGGLGLEIKSLEADTGYFFAYTDEGFPASISQSPVLIHGKWTGISCEYGRCAPEVAVQTVESVGVQLE